MDPMATAGIPTAIPERWRCGTLSPHPQPLSRFAGEGSFVQELVVDHFLIIEMEASC